MTGTSDLLVATTSATWEVNGTPVFVLPGLVVRSDSPIVKGHEQLFEELIIELAFDPHAGASKASAVVCGSDGSPDLEHGKERVMVSRWLARPRLLA